MNNHFRKLLTLLAAAFVFVPFLSGCDSSADDYKGKVVFEREKGSGSETLGNYGFTTSIDNIRDGSFNISDYICKRKYHHDPTVSWVIKNDNEDRPSSYSYYNLNIDDLNNEVLKIVDEYEPNYYGGYGFMFSLDAIEMPVIFEAPDAVDKTDGTDNNYRCYYSVFNFSGSPKEGKYKPNYIPTIDKFEYLGHTPKVKHRYGYELDKWELKEGQDLDFSTELKPITYVAKWKMPTHTITYKNVEEKDNPNPLTYTRGDSFELKPLDIPGVVFKGWVYNEEYITRIDESFTGDITLSADLEYTTYNAKFYIDNELVHTQYFDYSTKDFEFPEMPQKEGYTSGWNCGKITEMRNYIIKGNYSPIHTFVKVITDIDGVEIGSIDVNNTNFLIRDLVDSYKSTEYAVRGVYSDSLYKEQLAPDYAIKTFMTLYFKLEEYTHISNYNQFIEATSHPEKAYILDNDISFNGNKINTFNNFSGIFNGNGHTISNFKIEPSGITSTGITLFGNNSGTIKNLNLSNVNLTNSYVTETSTNYMLGLLTTTNTGVIRNVTINNQDVENVVDLHVGDDKVDINVKAGLLAVVNKGLIASSGLAYSDYKITMLMANGVINMDLKTTANYNLSLGALVGVNEGSIDHGFIGGGAFTFRSSLYKLEGGGSWSYANINGNVGGLVGENKGSIDASYSKSDLTYWPKTCDDDGTFFYDVSAWGLQNKVVIENTNNVGGLVGKNSGSIDKSYTKEGEPLFRVTQSDAIQFKQTSYFGGLVGYNSGEVSHSFAKSHSGAVYGNGTSERNTLYVGGFVGKNVDKAKISNCLSNGYVSLSGSGLLSAGFVGNNAGTVATCASQMEIGTSYANNSYAGFIYRNEETGYLRRNVSIGHLSSEVQYYHDFGYVNALGFSYGNYYILTSTEAEHMGYFDNIVPSTSDEMVKYDFLYDLGFDMSVWETRNSGYVLKVEWDE